MSLFLWVIAWCVFPEKPLSCHALVGASALAVVASCSPKPCWALKQSTYPVGTFSLEEGKKTSVVVWKSGKPEAASNSCDPSGPALQIHVSLYVMVFQLLSKKTDGFLKM